MITSHLSSRTQQNNHPQGQPGKRLPFFYANRQQAPYAKRIPQEINRLDGTNKTPGETRRRFTVPSYLPGKAVRQKRCQCRSPGPGTAHG